MSSNHQNRVRIAALVLVIGAAAGCKLSDNGLAGGAPGMGTPPLAPGKTDSGASATAGTGGARDGSTAVPEVPLPTASDAATADLVAQPDLGPPNTIPPTAGVDAAAEAATPPPAPSVCETLPAGLLPSTTVEETPRSDEFAFDNEGRLLAFSGNDVVRITRGAPMEIVARNLITVRGGGALRALSDGDIVVADYSRDRLVRIDARTGVERSPMSVRSPMKIVSGPGDTVFVTSDDGIIYRIDPKAVGDDGNNSGPGGGSGRDTPQRRVVANTNLALGGLSFSADYRKLYVGATEQDAIYAFPVDAQGSLGQQIRWAANVPKPLALATDACGNVYSVGNQDGRVRRIAVDGKATIIAELPGRNIWALSFGSGRHGFAADALYALDKNTGGLYEIKVGVGETPALTTVP
jgi:hypothetical protein